MAALIMPVLPLGLPFSTPPRPSLPAFVVFLPVAAPAEPVVHTVDGVRIAPRTSSFRICLLNRFLGSVLPF